MEAKKKNFFINKMFKANHSTIEQAVWIIFMRVAISELLVWLDPLHSLKIIAFRLGYLSILIAILSVQVVIKMRKSYWMFKLLMTVILLANLALRIAEFKYVNDMSSEVLESDT